MTLQFGVELLGHLGNASMNLHAHLGYLNLGAGGEGGGNAGAMREGRNGGEGNLGALRVDIAVSYICLFLSTIWIDSICENSRK